MTVAKKQPKAEAGVSPAPTGRTERAWWFDLTRELAQAHWIDAVAEEGFRRGLTPRAAADKMRGA
jgi:hypothetical protein